MYVVRYWIIFFPILTHSNIALEGALFCITAYLTALIAHYYYCIWILLKLISFKVDFFSAVSFLICDLASFSNNNLRIFVLKRIFNCLCAVPFQYLSFNRYQTIYIYVWWPVLSPPEVSTPVFPSGFFPPGTFPPPPRLG